MTVAVVVDRWLRLLARLSTDERAEWFAAMSAEIEAIEDPAAKRRFSRSCVRASLSVAPSTDPSGLLALGALAAAVAGCVASAAYGLGRYPQIAEGASVIFYTGAFAIVLVAYGTTGLVLLGLGSPTSRRSAVVWSAPALATATVAALGPGMLSAAIGVGVVLLPGAAAYRSGRGDRGGSNGLVAGLSCSVLAGMLTFVGFTVATYVAGGGSPTGQMLDEFHRSGMTDYTAWAVDDNLGGAVFLLVALPIVGSVVAVLGAVIHRR
jgi:hypothetical protein